MRDIKFRGKSIDSDDWVNGCLVNNMWTYSELSKHPKGTKVCDIITGIYESDNWQEAIDEESNTITVYPDSVGQFIGLLDKNRKEIHEGDVLKQTEYIGGNFIETTYKWFCVEWQGAGFSYMPLRVGSVQYTVRPFTENIEVIGNIYDNPELIE